MQAFTTVKTLRNVSAPAQKALRIFRDTSTRPLTRRCLHYQPSPPSLLRSSVLATRLQQSKHVAHQCRHESTTRPPRPLTDRPDTVPEPDAPKEEVPSYEMTFTCRVCVERSSHRITKQGYHHGTILITCPGCKNRHLISDHLKIFSDKNITIEDILKEKGQLLKKGSLGSEGDVEFWDDGSQSERKQSVGTLKSSDDTQKPSS